MVFNAPLRSLKTSVDSSSEGTAPALSAPSTVRVQSTDRAGCGLCGWRCGFRGCRDVSSPSEAMLGGSWGLRSHGRRGAGVQSPPEAAEKRALHLPSRVARLMTRPVPRGGKVTRDGWRWETQDREAREDCRPEGNAELRESLRPAPLQPTRPAPPMT